MSLEVGFVLVAALGVASALIGGLPAPQRKLTIVAALAATAVPLAVEGGFLLLRFLLGLTAALIVFRSIDLAQFGAAMPAWQRVWHMFAIFDTRRISRRAPAVEIRLILGAAFWSAVAFGAYTAGMSVAPTFEGAPRWLVRWLGAAVFAVAAVEVVTRVLLTAYALLGVRPPPLHDAPYLSRSVAEFWGTRWNRVVGTWLRDNCFRPFARRRSPRAGLVAAFAASAFLHWYLTFVAVGWRWSLPMAAFFLIQLALIGIERALGVARWPPAAARAWTLISLVVVSPLFSEPMLALLPA